MTEERNMKPGRKLKQIWKKYRLQIICIAGGFILYAVLRLMMADQDGTYISRLDRKGYGDDTSVDVRVEGLAEEELSLTIPVSGRTFSDDEIEAAFEACMEEVIDGMAAPGENIREVYSDLNLPAKMDAYGFRLQWTSRNSKILSSSGEVFNQEIEEPTDVELLVHIRDQARHADYSVLVTVMPERLDAVGRTVKGFMHTVGTADTDHLNDASFELPAEYQGKKLRYKSGTGTDLSFIWLAGILLAVFFYVHEKEKTKEKQTAKQHQVRLDYPGLVSRMMVFTGAGLTVRLAISAIAADAKRSGAEKRYAYDALCRADARLKTGMPESRVYRDFGRECGTRQYMKLAGLLEQNRRSGVAGMSAILRMEMTEAWEERKNLARRQGEEASTRLLLPLLMMLGIIMVMVMVPAMMTF